MKTKTLDQIIVELEKSIKAVEKLKKLPDYKPVGKVRV